jgi:hypothetical protein
VVTVTGIVRRPYPNAADRRFAVSPRFATDVRVAGRAVAPDDAGGPGSPGTPQGSGPDASTAARPQAAAAPDDADLIDLGAVIGRTVRVGGLVVDLRADGFTLDDGTAIGRVVLRAAALDSLALVEPDDALNVVGPVESTAAGPVVVVDDPAHIIPAGDPIAPGSPAAASPVPAEASPSAAGVEPSDDDRRGSRFSSFAGGPWPVDAGAAGLGTLFAISAASIAVAVLRREYARRRLAARIGGRLASFAGSADHPGDPTPAERGSSTNRSA